MSPKLKIGFVFDDNLDRPDGVQQYVLSIGSWLRQHGHEVHYLVGRTVRRDVPNVHSLSRNLNVSFNGNYLAIPLPARKSEIRRLLAKQNFDVLHVQMPFSPWLAAKVVNLAAKRTAVVGTFHIFPKSAMVSFATRLLGALLARPLKRFDKIVAVSDAAAQFAARSFGVSAKVVPNLVDVGRFTVARSYKDKSLPTRVVFLGRLVERKGCRQLLVAVSDIVNNATAKNFKVIIGGRGAQAAALKEFVAANDLQDIVEFRGFVSEDDKPAFLADSDIAVFPSTGGESFGIVLLEAMAASRGVVLAGNNAGYSSVMEKFAPQLFDPNNTAQFAACLAHFINDAPARTAAAKRQKEFVKRFDTDVVCRELCDVYYAALRIRSDMR